MFSRKHLAPLIASTTSLRLCGAHLSASPRRTAPVRRDGHGRQRLPRRTDRLQLGEGLANVVHRHPGLGQRLDRLSAARNEQRVEHGAALVLEAVARDRALATRPTHANGEDGRATGTDDHGDHLDSFQGVGHGAGGDWVVRVGNDNGHTARSNDGLVREEVYLAQAAHLLTVVHLALLLRLLSADHLAAGVLKTQIDLTQRLRRSLVQDGLVTVV